MKNIYLLPTDKPSRLYTVNSIGKLNWSEGYLSQIDGATNQNIYITSNEEIKDGDWYYTPIKRSIEQCVKKLLIIKNGINDVEQFKIILTTDQDLIKDGVQAIDDEFLKWFVKNNSCESVEIELIDTFKKTNEVYVDEITKGNYYEVNKQYKIIIPKQREMFFMNATTVIDTRKPKQKITMDEKLIPAEHIGDGLYMIDEGWSIAIAVNHHTLKVAFIDIEDVDRAIAYLQKVKERLKKG